MTFIETGLDASRYQGEIDWPAVAADGKQFALLRIGSTGPDGLYADPYFQKNVAGAHAAGLKVGAYYYTYARTKTQVAAELEKFLPELSGLRLEYPVFVDMEDTGLQSLGKKTLTDLLLYAMVLLDQAGWFPGYYTFTSFAEQYLELDRLAAYPLWIADHRGYAGVNARFALWQYSASGQVGGINGPVDLDQSYRDFLPELKAGGYNGYGGDGPVMEPLTGKELEVFARRCEYFASPDVNDVAGYLPEGRYPATALARAPWEGFVWVNFAWQGKIWWTVLLSDRCRLVDTQDSCEECRRALRAAREQIATARQLLEQALKALED